MGTLFGERGVGVLWRPDRQVLRVDGADRVDYLHRMLSQDVAGLEIGEARDACVLTPKGRLLGLPTVLRTGSEHLLDLDAVTVDDVVAALERTVITEDVTFSPPEAEIRRLTIVGPRAAELVATLVDEVPEPGRHVTQGEVRVLRRDLGGAAAYEVLVAADAESAVVEALAEAMPLEPPQWDALRVAERVPAWGVELGPDVMPLEARLGETAVSFTKGCYPGQEPVSMAHHRGHPANLLVRVELEDGAPAAGAPLLREGRSVGRLTTVAGDRALAMVRWDAAEEGVVLDLEGGGTARVLDPR